MPMMAAEYLENAIRFKQMAEAEPDAALKVQMLRQAAAYRELAAARAKRTAYCPTDARRQLKGE